jgi:hypothetical protein
MTTAEFATTAVAVYAAVVSTLVLAWDFVKWRMSGPRLRIILHMPVMLSGNGQDESIPYLAVTVTNVGDRPTTLNRFGAMVYKNDWLALVQRNRPECSLFFPGMPTAKRLPLVLEPGQQWQNFVVQSDLMTFASGKYLMISIFHSHSAMPALQHVRI